MQSISLQIVGNPYIERCEKCLGIFFDPRELESLLDASVSNVSEIDFDRMTNLIEEEGEEAVPEVVYVKCPQCGTLMNRENYGQGARSGVIIDVCKNHGVWLDGGELSKLLKWVKAGGLLFVDKKQAEQARKQERKARAASRGAESFDYSPDPHYGYHMGPSVGIITSIVGLVLRLLR